MQLRPTNRQRFHHPRPHRHIEFRPECATEQTLGAAQDPTPSQFCHQNAGGPCLPRGGDFGIHLSGIAVDSFAVNPHGATTVEPVLSGLLLRHRVRKGLGVATAEHVTSNGENLGFETASPDGAQNAAIRPHQHLGPLAHRNRTAALDQRAQHCEFAPGQSRRGGDDIIHQPLTSSDARSSSRA